MPAEVDALLPKETAKARSRCRAWIKRLSARLSLLSRYIAEPDACESLGLIALNGGVQTGVSPFSLRQGLLAHSHLSDDALTIYFSSLLPFAMVRPTVSSAEAVVSLLATAVKMEITVEDALRTVYMIRMPNLWTSGSSQNTGLSLLYLLCCRADLVLDALAHVFQPKTIGVEQLLSKALPAQEEGKDNDTAVLLLPCELVKEVPGLYIVRDFITQAEHDSIWSELKGSDASRLEVQTLARRKVAHFNRRFYYGVNQMGVEGESVNEKPLFFDWMQRRLRNADPMYKLQNYPTLAGGGGVEVPPCDQLTVNFYNYEEKGGGAPGIAHHVDAHSPFLDFVFIVSLGSHTVMEYSRYDRPPEAAAPLGVLLAPRSLVIMTGEARYSWTHGIAEKRVDIVSDRLPPLRRGDRVSLTWRRGRDGPHRRADCICKELCDGD